MSLNIHLLTAPTIDDENDFLARLGLIISNLPIKFIQLRLKDENDAIDKQQTKHIFHLINDFLQNKVAYDQKPLLIINDNFTLAKELDADGVHLGQSDGDIKEARLLLGSNKIIGKTCHNSLEFSKEAVLNGADYVSFGCVFQSETKNSPYRPDIDIFSKWKDISNVPAVAIGGINHENISLLLEKKVNNIAMTGSFWNCKDLVSLLKNYRNFY